METRYAMYIFIHEICPNCWVPISFLSCKDKNSNQLFLGLENTIINEETFYYFLLNKIIIKLPEPIGVSDQISLWMDDNNKIWLANRNNPMDDDDNKKIVMDLCKPNEKN